MLNLPLKQTSRAAGRIGLEFDTNGIFCAQVRMHGSLWHLEQTRTFCATEEILSGLRSGSNFVPFKATELLQAAAGFRGSEVAGVLPMEACDLQVPDLDLTGFCTLSTDRTIVADAVRMIQDGGFTIAGIDRLPAACARAVSLMEDVGQPTGDPPDSGSRLRMVVHIGWKRCMLVLLRDDIPIFARVPGVDGLWSLLSPVREEIGLTTHELRLIRGIRDLPVQPTGPRMRLDAAVRNWCLPICEEILRSIVLARLPGRRMVPSAVILMGSGGRIASLPEIMSEELNMDVRMWHLPADDNVNHGPEYAVAAALSAWDVA